MPVHRTPEPAFLLQQPSHRAGECPEPESLQVPQSPLGLFPRHDPRNEAPTPLMKPLLSLLGAATHQNECEAACVVLSVPVFNLSRRQPPTLVRGECEECDKYDSGCGSLSMPPRQGRPASMEGAQGRSVGPFLLESQFPMSVRSGASGEPHVSRCYSCGPHPDEETTATIVVVQHTSRSLASRLLVLSL